MQHNWVKDRRHVELQIEKGVGLLQQLNTQESNMSASSRPEAKAVKYLLSQSSQPYKGVQAGSEELNFLRGWGNIRPTAAYDLTQPHPHPRRQQQLRARVQRTRQQQAAEQETNPEDYMNGELDTEFNYHYGGDNKGDNNSHKSTPRHSPAKPPTPPTYPPPPPPTSYYQHRLPSTIHLDPLLPYHSAPPGTQARLDLEKIVALQLKPEVLVEQIIIENKLRTMNLGNLHPLNLEGVGVDPKSIHELDRGVWQQGVKSKSTPLLSGLHTQQHRKTHKRKAKSRLPLDWCTLNPDMTGGFGAEEISDENVASLEKSLLQVRGSYQDSTRYRLPRLRSQAPANPPHPPPPPPQQLGARCKQRLQQLGEPERGVPGGGGGRSLNIPVVAPSLRPTGVRGEGPGLGPGLGLGLRGQEEFWQQNKVKYANKLKSLGW